MNSIYDLTKRLDIQVKPCPFCGSRDTTITSKDFYEAHDQDGANALVIECDECGTDMWLYSRECQKDDTFEVRREKLIKKWNTRRSPKKED